MKKKQKFCDFYFGRNLISIIIILALLDKNKNKNKKILYISNNKLKGYANHLNKKFLNLLKDFFKEYFDEIHYVNYSRDLKKKNRLSGILERSRNIELNKQRIDLKINKDFTVSNIYAGGDDFENLLLKKLNYFPKFHLVEHGYGPLRDSIFFKVKLKDIFFNNIIKSLYYLKFISYYPISYHSYVGVLTRNINNNKFVNYQLIKKNNNLDLGNILKKICNHIKKKRFIKKSKLEFVLFNYSSITISKNKKEFNNLLKIILSLIDKKKECVLIKGHPNYTHPKTENFVKSLIKFLKKNNIKYLIVKNNSFLRILPSQIIVKLLKIKKIFSDLSTVPFHMSFDKKVKCYIPLDYAITNVSRDMYKLRDKKFKDFFYKIGKNIRFIKL